MPLGVIIAITIFGAYSIGAFFVSALMQRWGWFDGMCDADQFAAIVGWPVFLAYKVLELLWEWVAGENVKGEDFK